MCELQKQLAYNVSLFRPLKLIADYGSNVIPLHSILFVS